MEDILKFLLVAGILIVSFVLQMKKEAQKKASSQRPVVPQPETEPSTPSDNHSKETYGGYIPEGPAPAPPQIKKNKRPDLVTPPPTEPAKSENETDFCIHSTEEARRAIIWSEILTRKY